MLNSHYVFVIYLDYKKNLLEKRFLEDKKIKIKYIMC